MLSAVIFDLYNTLARVDIAAYRDAKREMARLVGVPDTIFLELWRQHSRECNRGDLITAEERVARVLLDAGRRPVREQIRQAADIEYRLQERSAELDGQARQVLIELKQMGLKLGLITTTGFPSDRVVELLQLESLFQAVVLSYRVRQVKPGGGIYQRVCGDLLVEPEACLYIGDGDDQEIAGAAASGMITVRLQGPRERLAYSNDETASDFVIGELTDAVPLVRRILTGNGAS